VLIGAEYVVRVARVPVILRRVILTLVAIVVARDRCLLIDNIRLITRVK
jgi:hypothetical protein